MVWIASAISSGSTGSFIFTNIPQTFTHLQVRGTCRSLGSTTNGEQLAYYYNNDRPNSYTSHVLFGNGSVAEAATELLNTSYATVRGTSIPNANSTANAFGSFVFDILDYSNTTKNKTTRVTWGWDLNGSGQTGLSSCLFTTTNAISRIDIAIASGSNTVAGSRFDLYGITTSSATGA
jgi:hypothetical protein